MSPPDAIHLLYVATFGGATVTCLSAGWQFRQHGSDGVRRGLVSLFVLSGVWAALTVGQLVSPSPAAKVWFYTVGLVVGFATVGCWLYFVSAYTGVGFHRDRHVRRLAAVVFLSVSAVKLTNGVHGRYFSYTLVADPFVHLSLARHWPHWVVTGVAYTLAGLGFLLLFRTYERSGYDRGPVALLATMSAVPVVPDLVSVLRPDLLIGVTYEPVGVAAFALGSLFVVETDSRRLRRPARTQLVDHLQDPVVVVDADGTVRDRNAAAGALFQGADHALAVGAPLPDRFESVIASTEPVVVAVDGEDRDFLVSRSAVEFGPHHRGWGYVFTDVTRLVSQQRELERQRRAMDDIAAATAHELRNDLNIASGYADLLCERDDVGDTRNTRKTRSGHGRAADSLRDAHARMRRVVDDLTSLARLAQPTRAVEPQRMSDAVAAARRRLTATPLAVDVVRDGSVVAEETRLVELLHKLFEHAVQRDASRVTVSVTARGFTLRHDGRPLADAESAFDYGTAAAEGIGLANAGALARVHGWTLSLSADDAGRTTVVATGVDTVPDDDAPVDPRTA